MFSLPSGPGRPSRVTVCEAAIDALSLAAIDSCRRDTLYIATVGEMGPETIAALQQRLQDLEREPAGMLVAAIDGDNAGRRYTAKLQEIVMLARVQFDAILPPNGSNDWNDAQHASVSIP